jgi:hypoxanthine-guanine phosphoribosyltransferase
MNNVIAIKDWLARHSDVRDCERALQLSDDVLQEAVLNCEDILDAAETLFSILGGSQ